ncbi:MAG: tetratricopeptide repeat protein [Bryobacteraceae bacterium]|nr:tetratricopeptide repeat protein [Bryobacteraceae bacterium]
MLLGWVASAVLAADPDAATRAYTAFESRNYDDAIRLFRQALASSPNRTDWRRQLAYTLLKTGETEAARDQFAEVIAIDPKDLHTTLEYAFLCHETKRTREARQVFDRLRGSADPKVRTTAAEAFQNIDGPLKASIERWQRALKANPGDFSAHVELAESAELRGEIALAAAHFRKAWELKPAERQHLVDYGRMAKEAGEEAQANAAFLAASRGGTPRDAEVARDLLPQRYPYAGEFQQALSLDPSNIGLRREFGFLLLAIGKPAEGEAEFERLLAIAPGDLLANAQLGLLRLARNETDRAMPLLEKVMKGNDEALAKRIREALNIRQEQPEAPRAQNWKALGEQSYEVGNLKDALRFFMAAREDDPADQRVNLKLGYTYNMLNQDSEAIRYFDNARKGPDTELKAEATRAFRNLRPALARFRTTYWALPLYSSRWREMFTYGQVKTEMKLGKLPFRPYVSVRFVGDSQRAAGPLGPGYLSESSFILGVGVATTPWHGMTAWSEAGNAVRYRERSDIGRMTPDYRGGLSYARRMGRSIQSGTPGFFLENTNDAVYLSRFNWNLLLYTQNRLGRTMRSWNDLQWQIAWNMNFTTDRKREPWANFIDVGPGIRFRHKRMPPSMVWTVDLLRGRYLITEGNPRKPVYYDLRVGIWYAGTR